MDIATSTIERNLLRFEATMMKTKGVKLPSRAAIANRVIVAGRKAHVIDNPLYKQIHTTADTMEDDYGEYKEYDCSNDLDDIILGVVRTFSVAIGHKGNKINVAVVRSMLDKLEHVSQLSIMDNYGYSRQQAGNYLRACKLVIMHNTRNIRLDRINKLKRILTDLE